MGDIRKMFEPKTIAVFGDMAAEGSVERILLANLLLSDRHKTFWVHAGANDGEPLKKVKKGTKPKPLVVSPTGESMFDLVSYPDVASIPEKVDLAVISSPAPAVPQIVEECGKAGVEGIAIISGGFREAGEEGLKLEEEVSRISKTYGMRVLGPNRGSIIRPSIGLNTSIFDVQPGEGNIAFISQSASIARVVLDWAANAHVGFSMVISLGSMADIDFGDLIDFLGEDPLTRSIMIYMESVGNARKFISAARSFARNKPIIVVKSGQFKESARASRLPYGVGLRLRRGIRGCLQAGRGRPGPGDHGPFQRFGGAPFQEPARRAVARDSNERRRPGRNGNGYPHRPRGKLARLSQESINALSAFLPSHWSKNNPVDLFGDADIERYTKAVNVCLADSKWTGSS